MRRLSATYRVQLRGALDFDALAARLDYVAGLGISHLYLSPVFTAAPGSTHGYDVTDPGEIDPVLGGRAGFERLAQAARARGLGIVLDIVPNHMALSMANPRLRDVLRHGARGTWGRTFAIDWRAGPLLLPMLGGPFAVELAEGRIGLGEDADGPVMVAGDLRVPLDPSTLDPSKVGQGDLAALHEAQPWRLAHWVTERDSLTHRRFFNITSLIGVRQEDPEVFEDTHALIFELVEAGLVQGLRVDHIDGLADPAGYLRRLAERVPVPVWVEKILTGDEPLLPWPTAGTTGYEAGAAVTRLLLPERGTARLQAEWQAETGIDTPYRAALHEARREVLRHELAAELHGLIALAEAVVAGDPAIEAGAETLREAVIALLVEMPRYRSYFADADAPEDDRALMAALVERAAAGLRQDMALRRLALAVTDAASAPERRFRTRYQQVTGALAAKAGEDTMLFRRTACLALNEVGSEPDATVLSADGFTDFAMDRAVHWPAALTLSNSHDTKRSADARMRLVAAARDGDAFAALRADAAGLPGAAEVPPAVLWYLVQSLVAAWDGGGDDLADRLVAHMEKALREAKEITTWVAPDLAAEAPVMALARALVDRWRGAPPAALDRLVQAAEPLSLVALALHLGMPGVPDVYAGSEGGFWRLTDPDNRPVVDWAALAALPEAPGLPGEMARLLRSGLALRARAPRFFARAAVRVEPRGDALVLTRSARGLTLVLTLRPDGPLERAVEPA